MASTVEEITHVLYNPILKQEDKNDVLDIYHTVLLIISYILITGAFFLILFTRSKKHTVIEHLMLIMCLSESIVYFSLFLCIINIYDVIAYLQINKVFKYLTLSIGGENWPRKIFFYESNNVFFTGAQSLQLTANILYNFELTMIIKNPLSDGLKRKIFYNIIMTITMSSSMIFTSSYVWLVGPSNDQLPSQQIKYMFDNQTINIVLAFVYYAFYLFSFIFVLGVLCATGSFSVKKRIFLLLKSVSYIVVYTAYLWFPVFNVFHDHYESLGLSGLSIFISLASIAMITLRLLELNPCSNRAYKEPDELGSEKEEKEEIKEIKETELIVKSASRDIKEFKDVKKNRNFSTVNSITNSNKKSKMKQSLLGNNKTDSNISIDGDIPEFVKNQSLSDLKTNTEESSNIPELTDITNEKIKVRHGTATNLSSSVQTHKKEISSNHKAFISNEDMSFNARIKKDFLIETMFYIIRGLQRIAEDEFKMVPITSKSYQTSSQYKFDDKSFGDRKDGGLKKIFKVKGSNSIFKKIFNVFTCRYCCKNVKFIDFYPSIFRNIFVLDGITNEQFKHSWDMDKNESNINNLSTGEGKSGSFFFFTHDNKFIIKTISDTEKETFCEKFAENYYDYVLENRQDSLLCRIYGIYTLRMGFTSTLTFILMENLAPISNQKLIERKFDLKGSTFGRAVRDIRNEQNDKVLKDKDLAEFKKMQKGMANGEKIVNFHESEITKICEQMHHDVDLLRKNNLMDYSLYIAIIDIKHYDKVANINLIEDRMIISKCKKKIYFLGIIDFLTFYNNFKKLETSWRSILNPSQRDAISAVDAVKYADRFVDFMKKELFEIESAEKDGQILDVNNFFADEE